MTFVFIAAGLLVIVEVATRPRRSPPAMIDLTPLVGRRRR